MELTDDDKYLICSWNDVEAGIAHLKNEFEKYYVFDKENTIIIGLTRGGLTPAVMLSHATGCPMHALDYSSNKGNGDQKRPNDPFPVDLIHRYSMIVIVDEIVDTAYTLKDLTDEISHLVKCYASDHDVTVKTMSLVYKERIVPIYEPHYHFITVKPDSHKFWIRFPWETNPYIEQE